MIDSLRLCHDIETLQNDIYRALKHSNGKAPNLHTMRALVACHDLIPYLNALIALQYGKNREQNTERPEIDIDPWTGTELHPGDPDNCQGNGEHPDFEICCDECNYFLACFPEDERKD